MRLTAKILLSTLAVIFLFSFFPNEALAYSNEGLGSSSSDSLEGVNIHEDPSVNGGVPSVEMPNVQIEQAKDFAERKGFDIVGLLQVFAQPFAIILFIFGGFLALIGAFGKSSSSMKGIIIMIAAVIIYAVVLSAPQLIDFGNEWLQS